MRRGGQPDRPLVFDAGGGYHPSRSGGTPLPTEGRIGRISLIVVDEVGYLPFDREAAALVFALVSSRYERSSIIVSSNKTFSAWAEIFADPVAVAALVDRLVHHAEVFVLRGDAYRLKGKGKEVLQGDDRD